MRPLTRTLTSAAALVAAATIVALIPAAPVAADHGDLPPGRQIHHYTVRAGDTATELAVRFHAWTAELVRHNHLGPDAALHVGQRIEVPVVTAAVDEERADEERAGRRTPSAGASRDRVRDAIVASARRHGVDPQLALAVSWQEAGWQMHHVSSAGAIGAMQVLPATGDWMEYYAGRSLRLRQLRDNADAGVLLLDVLRGMTGSRRHQVAAYYQGIGAVREHGVYDSSRGYVANVLAIEERLERGLPPA